LHELHRLVEYLQILFLFKVREKRLKKQGATTRNLLPHSPRKTKSGNFICFVDKKNTYCGLPTLLRFLFAAVFSGFFLRIRSVLQRAAMTTIEMKTVENRRKLVPAKIKRDSSDEFFVEKIEKNVRVY
jgi:hypothetical protein